MHTIANAMDVGNPSNFERMMWLYGGELEGVRQDVDGSRYEDGEVRATIKRVFDRTGYLLDPHSAIGYLGITQRREGDDGRGRTSRASSSRRRIRRSSRRSSSRSSGRPIERPAPLAQALERPRQILRLDATLAAVQGRGWRLIVRCSAIETTCSPSCGSTACVRPSTRRLNWPADSSTSSTSSSCAKLRDRYVRGEFPKREYHELVIEIRDKYPVLALTPRQWLTS